MWAGGKQGRERADVAGATRCVTHFSGLGAGPGTPRQLPRLLGQCHPLSPLPPLRPCSAPSSAQGSPWLQRCGTWLLLRVWPVTAPRRCCRQYGGPARQGPMSSQLGSAHQSLCALLCLGLGTRGQQCPRRATSPGDGVTVAGAPWCPQLRAAAAVPIVNGGLAATALSPAPQGEVY